jgi:hypothetical protein
MSDIDSIEDSQEGAIGLRGFDKGRITTFRFVLDDLYSEGGDRPQVCRSVYIPALFSPRWVRSTEYEWVGVIGGI